MGDVVDRASQVQTVPCPICGATFSDMSLDVAIALQMNHIRVKHKED